MEKIYILKMLNNLITNQYDKWVFFFKKNSREA